MDNDKAQWDGTGCVVVAGLMMPSGDVLLCCSVFKLYVVGSVVSNVSVPFVGNRTTVLGVSEVLGLLGSWRRRIV